MRNKLFLFALALSLVFSGMSLGTQAVNAQETVTLDSLQSGDLIRASATPAVYYYGANGFRYVFPNFNTYATWYGDDFSAVKWLSDTDLGKIQLGGSNVTYKPGVRMMKVDSDPRTWAVSENGTLHHVTSEQVAVDLYGDNWATEYVDDMPDGFFTNYETGDPINDASEFDKAALEAAATSINDDKGLVAPAEVSVNESGFSPEEVIISAGNSVRFTNDGSDPHAASADDFSWGTGTLQPGDSFIRTFEESGTYTYYDNYESSNNGTIIVQ